MKRFAVVAIHAVFLIRTALRAAGIIFGLLLLASGGRAQDKELPMPSPLKPSTVPSCNVVTHGVAQTLDAKTGLPVNHFRYRVEPSAQTGRKNWRLPEETMSNSNARRPGSLGDFDSMEAAVKACSEWQDAVYAARTRLLVAERTGR